MFVVVDPDELIAGFSSKILNHTCFAGRRRTLQQDWKASGQRRSNQVVQVLPHEWRNNVVLLLSDTEIPASEPVIRLMYIVSVILWSFERLFQLGFDVRVFGKHPRNKRANEVA